MHPPVIGICDSGVGGLSVWHEIRRRLPDVATRYLADQAHMPYGDRPVEEVRRLTEGIARFLLAQGAQIIVIACNTMSAAALHALRANFPDTAFIGMEPALKPAIEQTRSGVVGVLATQGTLEGGLFANLLIRYADGVRVLPQACPGLADAVERGALDATETQALLRRYLDPMLHAGVDQLVLGCTHYPFLRPSIEAIVGPGVTVIDPALAVARQTARILAKVCPKETLADFHHGKHVFYTSGDGATFGRVIQRLLPSFAATPPDVQAVHWQVASPQKQHRQRVDDQTDHAADQRPIDADELQILADVGLDLL